jgi:hypothetical protein
MTVPPLYQNSHFLQLEKHYLENPIALYVGAGVSFSSDAAYGLSGWNDFLESILTDQGNASEQQIQDFKGLRRETLRDKPWELASKLAEMVGGEEVVKDRIIQLVQKENNFQKKYKLLSGHYLKNAATLQAVSAFCASFSSGRKVDHENGGWTAYYRAVPNRRVHAVISCNYDPYLEAASSLMYRNPVLKPVGTEGSSIGRLTQIPVFHIHGYVPFLAQNEGDIERDRAEFRQRGVITNDDYERSWRSDNIYCFTMGPQIHILRHYIVLFIGFSMRDYKVNELLKDLKKERQKRINQNRRQIRHHYALLTKSDIEARGGDAFFNDIGVVPLTLQSYEDIPALLSHLYTRGLIHDHGDTPIMLPFETEVKGQRNAQPICLGAVRYFEELMKCRIAAVSHGKQDKENKSGGEHERRERIGYRSTIA